MGIQVCWELFMGQIFVLAGCPTTQGSPPVFSKGSFNWRIKKMLDGIIAVYGGFFCFKGCFNWKIRRMLDGSILVCVGFFLAYKSQYLYHCPSYYPNKDKSPRIFFLFKLSLNPKRLILLFVNQFYCRQFFNIFKVHCTGTFLVVSLHLVQGWVQCTNT